MTVNLFTLYVFEFLCGIVPTDRYPGSHQSWAELMALYDFGDPDFELWQTYAAENTDEYWAEGVQSWFGLNDSPGPIHNEINTRAELESYDPALAKLIREVFGETGVSASCHETRDLNHFIQGRVVGPDGKPLGGLLLWAWQGRRNNSGSSTTRLDGTFSIWVPVGSFTLDLYTGWSAADGCVGWFDGHGSITTNKTKAARVVVDDASVEGIEISLPKPPADLRRIRC